VADGLSFEEGIQSLKRPRFSALSALALFVLWASPSSAQAKPDKGSAPTNPAPTNPAPTNPPAPEGPAKAPRLARASVGRVADALAIELERAGARSLVVAAPLRADAPSPRGAELVALVAAQVAGRLGQGSRALPTPLALAEARSSAHGEARLVYVSASIEAGKLRVAADVFPIPRTVWARIRDPEPGPLAHAFAEAPIDAEVRAYLVPIPLVAANVVRARNFESDVVALACGDLDGDGALEIMSVSRRRVTTLRLREGKVVPLRSRTWADLSPLAASPLREPIGLAALVERALPDGFSRFLDVGLTDRAKALRLDGELAVVAQLQGLPVAAGEGSGCAHVATPLLGGPLSPCLAGDPPPLVAGPGLYDALAAAPLVSPRGEGFVVLATRDDRGVLTLRDDAGHAANFEGAGAQLAVGDLDQDGDPEILSGLDVPSAAADAVVVRSWPRGASGEAGKPREIFRLPAAAGVHALAVCPPDGPLRAPFVVGTADEIWVVR